MTCEQLGTIPDTRSVESVDKQILMSIKLQERLFLVIHQPIIVAIKGDVFISTMNEGSDA